MKKEIKTRFAPSPTGFLHIGGLRAALFAYLYSNHHGGKFVLRVEDTDRERFVEGGMENMINSLHWAGIEIDEGVDMDESGSIIQKGDCGPYIQSERLEIYKTHVDELVDNDHAYPCFCSKERLGELREIQEANKQPTGYDGHCRALDKDEVKKKIEVGESYVVRMKMPDEGVTKVQDLVRGEVEFKNELIDDQVILKADGFPTYHLAVVVDDHHMGISHVIRGEEWLPSTPKHVVLYNMFGWEAPEFAHISLLVNEKRQKLSKRHGDVSVHDYIDKGYLPEALNNFSALLGWNPGDDREVFSMDELIKEFDFDKVGKAAAVFDLEKLNWFNKHYIMSLTPEDLAEKCESFYKNSGVEVGNQNLAAIVKLEQGRANTLLDIVENTGFIFANELDYEPELLVWKKSTKEDAKNKLQELKELLDTFDDGDYKEETLETKIGEWIKEKEYGMGDVLWPMRVALSGQKNSPGPFEIAAVLGKEKTLTRVGEAIEKL
jgi:nondiscriminating glutamyl-tRNA synthetase